MDTLECLKKFKHHDIFTISIVNVLNSSIARMSDYILPTLAGPEIGVASTKAFTSQLAVLALLALHIKKYTMQNVDYSKDAFFQSLFEIQQNMERILKNSNQYHPI